MPPSLLPENEAERINALNQYRILGTSPEESYDDITKIASTVCSAPIALMSLVDVDSQRFKSKVGIDIKETPRDWSFALTQFIPPIPLSFQMQRWTRALLTILLFAVTLR